MKKVLQIIFVFVLLPSVVFAQDILVAGAANVQFTLDDLKAEFGDKWVAKWLEAKGLKTQALEWLAIK